MTDEDKLTDRHLMDVWRLTKKCTHGVAAAKVALTKARENLRKARAASDAANTTLLSVVVARHKKGMDRDD